jgi:hypothetical protein
MVLRAGTRLVVGMRADGRVILRAYLDGHLVWVAAG